MPIFLAPALRAITNRLFFWCDKNKKISSFKSYFKDRDTISVWIDDIVMTNIATPSSVKKDFANIDIGKYTKFDLSDLLLEGDFEISDEQNYNQDEGRHITLSSATPLYITLRKESQAVGLQVHYVNNELGAVSNIAFLNEDGKSLEFISTGGRFENECRACWSTDEDKIKK